MFIVPLLAGTRDRTIDIKPVVLLSQHLGLARFVSVYAISPNYGSYFRLASVNYNELPISDLWASYAAARLNSNPSVNVFNGVDPDLHRQAAWLAAHRSNFSEIGIKYLLACSWADSLHGMDGTSPMVWHEGPFIVRELQHAKPCYEILGGHCSLRSADRDVAAGSCDGPARLLRRELFFPGWAARVNAKAAELRRSNEIFHLPGSRASAASPASSSGGRTA